jgi:hypothetical protein
VSTPTGSVLALLKEFSNDMRIARTIHQLSISTGKAYANTHATTTQLLEEGILTKETVGHSHQCRLNLSNDKTLLYLCLLETQKRDELFRRSPEAKLLLNKIDQHSAKLGILLAWKREKDLLVVTTTPQLPVVDDLGELAVIPLSLFMSNEQLRATISGEATLLFGHALYASLLREVRK